MFKSTNEIITELEKLSPSGRGKCFLTKLQINNRETNKLDYDEMPQIIVLKVKFLLANSHAMIWIIQINQDIYILPYDLNIEVDDSGLSRML